MAEPGVGGSGAIFARAAYRAFFACRGVGGSAQLTALVDVVDTAPAFWPLDCDWYAGGVVQRRSKWMASATMAASALLMLWWGGPRWTAWLAMTCMGSVLLWLWRRPEALPPALTDAH